MSAIKIHVLHTGQVCVAPDLPFGGDDCSILKASGIGVRRASMKSAWNHWQTMTRM